MIVRLHEIRESGLTVSGEESNELLDLDRSPEVADYGKINYELRLRLTANELIVDGRVWADVKLECARCGVFFSTTCINSAFLRAYEVKPGSDEVDISDDLREGVLLQMPAYSVCKDSCRGLCVQCGTDLNETSCQCEGTQSDIRWSALDELDL